MAQALAEAFQRQALKASNVFGVEFDMARPYAHPSWVTTRSAVLETSALAQLAGSDDWRVERLHGVTLAQGSVYTWKLQVHALCEHTWAGVVASPCETDLWAGQQRHGKPSLLRCFCFCCFCGAGSGRGKLLNIAPVGPAVHPQRFYGPVVGGVGQGEEADPPSANG